MKAAVLSVGVIAAFAVVLVVFTASYFGYFVYPSRSVTIYSVSNYSFNVTPDTLYINWTNGNRANITIGSNSSFTFETSLTNNNTALSANYSQESSNVYLNVSNHTGVAALNNFVTANGIFNYTLQQYCSGSSCQPGRYRATLTIRNSSNVTENANVTVIVDKLIPIGTSGIGSFQGTMSSNATEFQSFFFDPTSTMPNATAIYVNLTWNTGDLDAFLLTNDSTPLLLTKGINKTGVNEKIYFSNFSVNKTFEIRIYGNISSASGSTYSGTVVLSNLNYSSQFIDFGNLNITLQNTTNRTFVLSNRGNFSISSLTEHKELYYVKKFVGSGTGNFSLLLPDSSIISKVEVNVSWPSNTGGNYSLRLFNNTGLVDATSVNIFVNANLSQVNREEYLSTTNIGTTNGIWTVEVKAGDSATPVYNLTVRAKVNESAWLGTNFTSANTTFDTTGLSGANENIQLNLIVQNSTFDGLYEGRLIYQMNNDGRIIIPIQFNVNSTMLVGNDTLNSKLYTIDENWGANLSKTIIANISNPGSYAVSIVVTNTTNLACSPSSPTTCSGYLANLTIQNVTTINARSSALINATIAFNSTLPRNTAYEGWILINSSNSDGNLVAHPNETFRINLKLNLTDRLNVTVTALDTQDNRNDTINVTKEAKNVSATFRVNLVNGTIFGTGPSNEIDNFNYSKIFNIWLYEPNASYTYPCDTACTSAATRNMTNYSSVLSGPVSGSTVDWRTNITIPVNLTGGRWQVHINATSKDNNYFGDSNGIFQPLIVHDTGLFLTAISSQSMSSITAGNTAYFNVTIKNFGPKAASSAQVKMFDNNCTAVTITASSSDTGGSGCTSVSGTSDSQGGYFGFDLPGSNSDGCWVRFKVTGDTNGTCSGSNAFHIKGVNGNWYNNITGITITVNPASGSSSTSTDSSTSGGAAGTTATAAKYLEITTYPSILNVEQAKSNSTTVFVKNINTTKVQDISLKVQTIESSWATVSPALQSSIGALKETNFTVTFNVPSSAEVKDHDSKFVAVGNYGNVSANFKLRVLPSPETKVKINETFALVNLNYTKLGEELNKSKSSGLNTTEADAKYAELTLKVKQAQDALSAGDYFTANVLITEIKSLMDETYAALASAKATSGFNILGLLNFGGNTTYIIVAGAVAGGLILAYLFWPTKIKPAIQDRLPQKISAPKILQPSRETYLRMNKLKDVKSSIEENVWDRLRDKWAEFSKKRQST